MAAESVEIAKQIEAKFLDFESLNIFREDEAVYNFTILRKRDELDNLWQPLAYVTRRHFFGDAVGAESRL